AIEPLIVLLKNELDDKFNRQWGEMRYIREPAHSYVIRALAELTGRNYGDCFEKWEGWWKENQDII
ncbi:MAG: hypothetical protein SVY10_03525, partial [Thermodesulfobacteriota bacterium]|nr:hypothetical protein [Thermodesulfobacteriota bacterium]